MLVYLHARPCGVDAEEAGRFFHADRLEELGLEGRRLRPLVDDPGRAPEIAEVHPVEFGPDAIPAIAVPQAFLDAHLGRPDQQQGEPAHRVSSEVRSRYLPSSRASASTFARSITGQRRLSSLR